MRWPMLMFNSSDFDGACGLQLQVLVTLPQAPRAHTSDTDVLSCLWSISKNYMLHLCV